MSTEPETPAAEVEEMVFARIGYLGGKIHPAAIHPRYGFRFRCTCPGTRNGAASGRAVIVKGATESNCQN